MEQDAGQDMKTRLRADLRVALKGGRAIEVRIIRALVAALDNAEAPPIAAGTASPVPHRFESGSAEVERLLLSLADVRRIVRAEIEDRERAAAEFDRIGKPDRAQALRAEALLAKRYVE